MKRVNKVTTATLFLTSLAIATTAFLYNNHSGQSSDDQIERDIQAKTQHKTGNDRPNEETEILEQAANSLQGSIQGNEQGENGIGDSKVDLAALAFSDKERDLIGEIQRLEDELESDRTIERLNRGEVDDEEREELKLTFFELNDLRASLAKVKLENLEAKMREFEEESKNG